MPIITGAVALVAAISAGCGEDAPKVPESITGAADEIALQGPTRFEGDFGFGQFKSFATGSVDMAKRRSYLETTIAGLGKNEFLTDQDHAYFRLPPSLYRLDKPWLDIDLSDPPKSGAALQMVPLANNGPLSALEYLRGATAAEPVGSEKVRGKQATHYKVTSDLKRAAAKAPAADRALVTASVLRTIPAIGGRTSVTSDVWIGDDGHLLRQMAKFTLNGQQFTFDMTFIGPTNRQITLPPKSQTISAKKL